MAFETRSPDLSWLPHGSQVPWPHAPEHRLTEAGTYFVTAGTYGKHHHFRHHDTLRALHDALLGYASDHDWRLEAWAVFSNHYHFVGHSPKDASDGAASLSTFLGSLHSRSSDWLNSRDDTPARKVWHNFRETLLTYRESYWSA